MLVVAYALVVTASSPVIAELRGNFGFGGVRIRGWMETSSLAIDLGHAALLLTIAWSARRVAKLAAVFASLAAASAVTHGWAVSAWAAQTLSIDGLEVTTLTYAASVPALFRAASWLALSERSRLRLLSLIAAAADLLVVAVMWKLSRRSVTAWFHPAQVVMWWLGPMWATAIVLARRGFATSSSP